MVTDGPLGVLYRAEFDRRTVRGVLGALGGLVEGLVEDPRRLVIVVGELADNVLHHSGRDSGWCDVVATGDRLVVTIRDRGVGIHASMRRAYPDIEEGLAVTAAFSGGVTSEVGPVRGLGLMMVLSYTETGADLLLETGGVAYVGIGGKGRLVGKSTQYVEGVTAMLQVPLVQ